MRLITMRSNDQFNTTIYGYDDRFRGVKGTRMVLFMNRDDIARLGLRDAQTVHLVGATDDKVVRRVEGFRVLAYDIPTGCVGGYYPECNPLIRAGERDASGVPDYNAVVEVLPAS